MIAVRSFVAAPIPRRCYSGRMRQSTHRMAVSTRGKGFYEITADVVSWLARQSVQTGLLTVFIQHTSASLVIQ
jgi:thiamine phosphate synthase YjbQ (UPF0047 family)